jgi:release factor glutamine methyltransferase
MKQPAHPMKPVTIAEALARAADALRSAGVPTPEQDVERLLRHVLGFDRGKLLAEGRSALTEATRTELDALVQERARRRPLQHLVGTQAFWKHEFLVGPDVLIPRPETELLVEAGLAAIADLDAPRILDIGTGSGCLAVTFAAERPRAIVTATDVSGAALARARENAAQLGVSARVVFSHAAGVGGHTGPFDLVVVNPPYVPEADRAGLQPEVRLHEPAVALFAGADGLDVVRAVTADVRAALRPGGTLAMEIGIGQADAAVAIVRRAGFVTVSVRGDLQGIPRVVAAST